MHSETSKNGAKRRCFVHFHFQMWFSLQRCAIFPHLSFKKCSETVNFLTFDLQMYLSLQRRVIFPHLNFKKWSEPDMFFKHFDLQMYLSLQRPVCFLAFWFWNVLLATAACNFSRSQLQKVLRACSDLHILTLKCASRYSGV